MDNELKPDYRIGYLSLLGLTGLMLGCAFLFYDDLKTPRDPGPVFHEVIYNPKEIAGNRITAVIDSLEKEEINIKLKWKKENALKDKAKNTVPDSLGRQLAFLDKKIDIVEKDINILKEYRTSFEHSSENDTISFGKINNALHFHFDPYMLRQWDDSYTESIADSVRWVSYSFKDQGLSFSIWGTGRLVIREAASDISFVTKYPNAGLWVLLIMIFCSFLLISISTCFYILNKIIGVFKEYEVKGLKRSQFIWTAVFTLVGLFAFWSIGKMSFNDEDVVRGIYFLRRLEISMMLIQVLGFIAGACCLAGFIYTAAVLALLANNVKDSRKSIIRSEKLISENQVKSLQGGSEKVNADQAIKTNSDNIELKKANIQQNKEIFEKLRGYFQTYFILSAVILSLLVLCTGGLYSIINNLDFVKMISNDWGYSPARTDYIYLYGGFYTIILLLVYIPAKMRFAEISFPEPVKDNDVAEQEKEKEKDGTEKESKWYGFLKNPFAQLTDLLVATSPLLASLVQTLYEILFG